MRADWEREALAAVEEATRERLITHEQMVTAVADALEPLIRADEREHQGALFLDASGVGNMLAASIQEAIRLDLRAKVKALPGAYIAAGVWENPPATHDIDNWDGKPVVLRADVLALLEGNSDA